MGIKGNEEVKKKNENKKSDKKPEPKEQISKGKSRPRRMLVDSDCNQTNVDVNGKLMHKL